MNINRSINTWFVIAIALITVNVQGAGPTEYRRLSVKEYRDKMKGAWLVQVPSPGHAEKSYEPGPIANSKFTPEEMEKIAAGRPEPRK